MAKTDAIDVTKPAGSRDPKLGDDDIRELARAVVELINKDHYVGANGGAGVGYNEDAAGEHAKITLNAPLADHPTAETSKGHIYLKDVGGKAELHWQDEDGDSIQIMSGGTLNPAIAMLLTGNQTVAGVKTFSSIPKIPTTAPTADEEVAGKKYVDDNVTALGAWPAATTVTANPTTSNADVASTEAATDGFFIGVITSSSYTGAAKIEGRTGPTATDPPTEIKGAATINFVSSGLEISSFCIPVRKGDFYKADYTALRATMTNCTRTYYFIALD